MARFIDKWIEKLEGNKDYNLSEEDALRIVFENIIASLKQTVNVNKLLFAGSISKDDISHVGQRLSSLFTERNENCPQFLFAGNVLADPETIDKAAQCDSIILVERKNESAITEIEKQIMAYQDMGKKILGYIMV
ncbi:hypothetical protein ACRQV7_05925 [Caproiciproducens sp. R2]|uniref:hypothetical protein n=1 Tax=Caproiciproducens sp. R2 TaxID=3435187 RepID=UPI0040331894